MTARKVEWSEFMSSLGAAVVAIGVFDGVHLGHQALLAATVAEAELQGTIAAAVTFDRDPDQVVSPESAAPQLLSLEDKIRFIGDTGIDVVLVIPFTPEVAHMQPYEFLHSVLSTALRPVALHVGRDFRFGARASGDLAVLESFGQTHGFQVTGHELVEVDGEPITSTRIRALVAGGEVAAASALLGRPPRLVGTVRRGRGEGAKLGFPTANVVPDEYAALPADGVYAGRALLAQGTSWASAISVGTPPTFPEARDYLEAHLIDYDGDLYDEAITLEFFERLRSQRPFASLPELTAAIAEDVEQALEIAGFDIEQDDDEFLDDESPVVADPAALEAAERAVMGFSMPLSCGSCASCAEEIVWEPVITVVDRASIGTGARGFMLAAPLEAAGIPYSWDPYAPEDRPSGLPGAGAFDQPFTLLVPQAELERALQLIEQSERQEAQPASGDDLPGVDGTPWIEDAALLEAAESAARTADPDESEPIDWDSWVPLLIDQPNDRTRLMGLEFALTAVGIPVKWDPYSPARAGALDRGFFRAPVFTLAVPADRFVEAQSVIEHHEPQAD